MAPVSAERAAGALAVRAQAPYRLILANILARPLVSMAGRLRRMSAAGGTVVLSGLQIDQERWVTAAYRGHGFRLVRRIRSMAGARWCSKPLAQGLADVAPAPDHAVDLAPPQADIGQQAVIQALELALGARQGEETADALGDLGDDLGESAQADGRSRWY